MLQQRQLSSRARGIMTNPRDSVGQYLDDGMQLLSGTTYGGQGLGEYWDGYPNIISGKSELDAAATQTGSNVSAAQFFSGNPDYYNSTTAIDAGLDGAPTGSANGGTSF